jgi:hypothetical protein
MWKLKKSLPSIGRGDQVLTKFGISLGGKCGGFSAIPSRLILGDRLD